MRIVVFEVEEWERDAFETLEENHDIDFTTEALTAETEEKHADAEIISTFIYSELDADVLKQFRNLHLIATRSTGFDHIDLDYCEQNGVTICNVPTYGENTVAEHVFGLLLTISHNIFEALERTAKGDFSMKGLRGFDLRGKTLGVIGTGHIGQCVIEIARGFGMEVLAYDVKPREELASELNFRYADLKKVLSEADVITLHVPASKATHHLLSDDEFEHMKQDVVLINTARGSVIDVQALVRALADGKVRAAGLDVLPEEPVIREEAELLRSVFREEHDLRALLADHVLLRLRNVYITPHSAFNTREAVQRILDTTVQNIRGFVRDEAQNVVHGT